MTEATVEVSTSFGARLREGVTDALRYWEPRRLVFNAVLAVIVLSYFGANWPHSRKVVSLEGVLLRWILFLIGLTFASIITRWFAMAFFTRPPTL